MISKNDGKQPVIKLDENLKKLIRTSGIKLVTINPFIKESK